MTTQKTKSLAFQITRNLTAEAVKQCAASGWSVRETAEFVGVSKRTLESYIYFTSCNRPDITLAWKIGKRQFERNKQILIEKIKRENTQPGKI